MQDSYLTLFPEAEEYTSMTPAQKWNGNLNDSGEVVYGCFVFIFL